MLAHSQVGIYTVALRLVANDTPEAAVIQVFYLVSLDETLALQAYFNSNQILDHCRGSRIVCTHNYKFLILFKRKGHVFD